MNVLISGGSRGIGAACVELFTLRGWRAAFIYRSSEDKARALSEKTGALAIRADVSSDEGAKAAVDAAMAELGRVDALINNAGVSRFGLFTDMSQAEWDGLFSVNVGGMTRLLRSVLPGMISRKSGSVVNLSSIWGQTGASCEVAYSASKAAVIGLTRALALELGPSGVRVNCVAPGVIDTDMNAALSPETLAELREQTALCSLGTPMQVAEAVYFLASEQASFITGQVLGVNGGFQV